MQHCTQHACWCDVVKLAVGTEQAAGLDQGTCLTVSSVKGLRWCVRRTAGKDNVGKVGVTAAGPVGETHWEGSSSEPCQREESRLGF